MRSFLEETRHITLHFVPTCTSGPSANALFDALKKLVKTPSLLPNVRGVHVARELFGEFVFRHPGA